MESSKIIEELYELSQVNIDTVHAYNQVLDQITDDIIRDRLVTFRDSHWEHIVEISDEIVKMGGEKPSISKDFKGYVIAAFTALKKGTGTHGALKALKTTEEIINQYYQKLIPTDYPRAIMSLIRRHFSDERNHLDYIKKNLQALDLT